MAAKPMPKPKANPKVKPEAKPEARTIYERGGFSVTATDIRTPSIYYPVADTVGRIRHDLFFAALGYSVLIGAALILYADLWLPIEMAAMALSILLALLLGREVAILQLDARGFEPRLFIARRQTVRGIFQAIVTARAAAAESAQPRPYGLDARSESELDSI